MSLILTVSLQLSSLLFENPSPPPTQRSPQKSSRPHSPFSRLVSAFKAPASPRPMRSMDRWTRLASGEPRRARPRSRSPSSFLWTVQAAWSLGRQLVCAMLSQGKVFPLSHSNPFLSSHNNRAPVTALRRRLFTPPTLCPLFLHDMSTQRCV